MTDYLLLAGGGQLLLADGPGSLILDASPPAEYPEITVEVAFGYTWQDASPVWTDITGDVEFDPGLVIDRGRSRELDTFGTGTAGFVLVNDDRRYDPSYADGPHYGLLKPNVPVRIRASYSGTVHDLFRGFIDGWPQAYTPANQISLVSVSASDAFKLLANLDLTLGYFTLDDADLGVLDVGRLGGEAFQEEAISGERVDALLDLATWPTVYRGIDEGATLCQPQDADGSALNALQLVEASEDGFLYVEADGKVTFVGRYGRQEETRLASSQVTFSDADEDRPYDNLTYVYDDQLIYNDVRRTREGGVEQSVVDDTSIADYFRRPHSETGLLMTSDETARDLATVFLGRYREPVLRIDDLVIDPSNNPGVLWPQVLGRRVLDRITVERTPQEIGDPIIQEMLIQGIKHSYSMFKWRTTYYVTPADSFTFLTLDDTDLGVLDEDLVGA